MDDIKQALAAAWSRIAPKLTSDPAELQRRLARRQNALISSPLRAWCLAVRASDTRLDRYCLSSPHPSTHSPPHSHKLLLDADSLAHLCTPIHIPAPGLTIDQLARLLGVPRAGLLPARPPGVLRHNYIPCARGNRHNGQQPLLYTDQPLDPAARSFAQADPAWSITARHAPLRIPRKLKKQTLTRVPTYFDATAAYRDKTDLHPEHPAHGDTPRRKRSLALPPAPPDPVGYKWKGDEYIGYDWRAAEKNPRIRENYERRQARLAKARSAGKRRRRENPPASSGSGSLKFRGWKWLCPLCQRKVNLLFYPLPRLHLLPLSLRVRGRPPTPSASFTKQLLRADKLSRPHAPKKEFACEKCHRIKRISRCDKNAWNELVTYLSAGLLFGREVDPPAWFPRPESAPNALPGERPEGATVPTRKIAYTPRPNRSPSQRRPEIERMLLAGQTFKQIAAALGLRYGTILWFAQQIYQQHGVRTLPELLKKHGQPIPGQTHLTPEIRRRLLEGQPIPQIAAELGVNKTMIYNQRQQMRKHGHKLPDAREFNRVGVKHVPTI